MIQPDDQNNQNNQHDQVITSYTPTDDDAKHQQAKPPSVLGEEDAFSGDMPAESPDIDEELEKVGLNSDKNGPEPLPGRSILEEEEK